MLSIVCNYYILSTLFLFVLLSIIILFAFIIKSLKTRTFLREENNKTKVLAEISPIATIMFDIDTVLFMNLSASKLTGYSFEELKSKKILDIIHSGYKSLVEVILNNENKKGLKREEIKIITKSGYEKWVELWIDCVNIEKKSVSVLTAIDISVRKDIEDALFESEQRYKYIIDTTNEGVALVDKKGVLIFLNQRLATIFGYNMEELLGRSFFDFMDEEWKNIAITKLRERYKVEKELFEFKFLKKNGEELWTQISASPYFENNRYIGSIAMILDNSDRKKTEKELNNLIKQKEQLIKEIHHRLKNNLTLIMSVINIQMRRSKNEQVICNLEDVRGRIKTISDIHERLYLSNDYINIDIKKYITDLINFINGNYVCPEKNINIKIEVDDLKISVSKSISIGLIINELVTNSIKYAFQNVENGEILLSLKNYNNKYVLVVKDDGVGIKDGFDFKNCETTGLKIVNSLITQLCGDVEVNVQEGFEIKISFDKDNEDNG